MRPRRRICVLEDAYAGSTKLLRVCLNMLRTFQNGKILGKNTSSSASAVGCRRTGSGASAELVILFSRYGSSRAVC